MCGLAQICLKKGCIVAGSDREVSHRTRQLEDMGVKIYYGHSASHIDEFMPDDLVYSVAVPIDNPELVRAGELGIEVIERSYFLGALNKLYNKVINIAGTHGKTTTTTLCALMLEESGLDPTAHIGAEVSSWNSTVRVGADSEIFVSEACEYNSSFLRFYSTTAAVLNIDHDHLDCFPTIEDVVDAFVRFANTLPDGGKLVIPSFDRNMPLFLKLLRKFRRDSGREMPEIITFGSKTDILEGRIPDFCSTGYRLTDGYPEFDVLMNGSFCCHVRLVIPGEYNAMNALAAIACSVLNGASPEACSAVLSRFYGADNRFNLRGSYLGAQVYSDYAHHPSALKAAYSAASDLTKGSVWAVFQPITYNRVIGLFHEFVEVLSLCTFSLLFEVYTSRETDNKGFSSRSICDEINAGSGGQSVFVEDFSHMRSVLKERVKPGDIILFMGPERMEDYADMLTDTREDTSD
jgi:UDP-N-acetylmuramate--alanine ligase